MFPWTIWRVPYLSSNQKLLQMQEYTHVLMHCTGSPPYVPYDALVPHACKQVLNMCPIETMNIIVLLLPLGQRLSTDNWPCHMEAPLVCTIHGANLIIRIMPLAPFRPFAIPTENIRRCPRGQRTNPNDVAQAVNGNRNFVYAPGVLGLNKTSQRMPPMDAMLRHPCILGGPQKRGTKSEVKMYARGHHDAPSIKAWIQRL